MKEFSKIILALINFSVTKGLSPEKICCCCSNIGSEENHTTPNDILIKYLGGKVVKKIFMIAKNDTNVNITDCVNLEKVIKALCVLQQLEL